MIGNDNNDDDDDASDVSRMEQMLAAQQGEEDDNLMHDDGLDQPPENVPNPFGNDQNPNLRNFRLNVNVSNAMNPMRKALRIHYVSSSIMALILHVLYILRTRGQVYLALLYLTSSKVSYIIIGNAVLALCISFYYRMVQIFLGGLRLMESETIADLLRWNVTDTCFAITMFRPDLNVGVIGMFLVLILAKALHWAMELRGDHLRVTDDVFYFTHEDEGDRLRYLAPNTRSLKVIFYILPKSLRDTLHRRIASIPWMKPVHAKFLLFCFLLMIFDFSAIFYCTSRIMTQGPSVHIFFGFEAAILIASAASTIALFQVHVLDGLMSLLHHAVTPTNTMTPLEAENQDPSHPRTGDIQPLTSIQKIIQQVTNSWRDNRATLTFIIELFAQASKFLFNLTLFAVVLVYYGLPINIFRELYFSYQKLRERLSSFVSYRRLTLNMNERFESIESDTELDTAGRTCIICRDMMDTRGIFGGCKKLPICGHAFHKHCLREWLVQQQSCPTCRADIQANEAKAKLEKRKRELAEKNSTSSAEEVVDGKDSKKPTVVSETGLCSSVGRTFPSEMIEKSNGDACPTGVTFPCLYRIIESGSTALYMISPTNGQKANTVHEIKRLPNGRVVLCVERRKIDCSSTLVGSTSDDVTSNRNLPFFLRTPDGWISETAAEVFLKLKASP